MISNKLYPPLALLIGLFLLIWQPHAFAQPKKIAGYVLASGGAVSARSENGVTRQLRRRSSVFEGDTITTRGHSVQIRFSDGSLTSLRPNTRFKIERYRWEGKEDGSEKGFFSLLKGGLRTLSGLIGKRNRDSYRMKTPVATIGIRGTDYGLRYCNGDCPGGRQGLFGGVFDGSINVDNPAGQRGYGSGDFFQVPANNRPPQTLLAPPPFQFGRGSATEGVEENTGENTGENGDTGTGETESSPSTTLLDDSNDGVTTPSPIVTENLSGTTSYTTETTTTTFFSFLSQPSVQYEGVVATVSKDSPAAESVTTATVEADLPTNTSHENTVVTADFADNHGGAYCSSCDFDWDGTSNIKDAETYSNTQYTVNRGRWRDSTYTLNGVTGHSTATGVSFIRSDNVSTTGAIDALGSLVATFNNINTSFDDVVNQNGVVNDGGLQSLSFEADFSARTISDFAIQVEVGGVNTGLVKQNAGASVSFTTARETGISLESTGTCTSCNSGTTGFENMNGTATVEFLGSEVKSAMGSYSLHNDTKTDAFVGTYVVDR